MKEASQRAGSRCTVEVLFSPPFETVYLDIEAVMDFARSSTTHYV